MLIPNKLNTIIRILLANNSENEPKLRLTTLANKAKITSAMAKRLVLRLERSGYVKIRGIISVIDTKKLMRAWAYCYSIHELEKVTFVAAERPQYVMLKIANKTRIRKLSYAFTLFSATEHISPYVAPSDTYLYIHKKDVKEWTSLFRGENILPAEKGGNVILLPVDEDYFEGVWTVRDMSVVSLPQLYADLFSYGGRGEEAAAELIMRI